MEACVTLAGVPPVDVDAVRGVRTRLARGRRCSCALVNVDVTLVAFPAHLAAARAGHVITGEGRGGVARAGAAAARAEGARRAL